MSDKAEGSLSIEQDGMRYEGRWHLADGVVSVYVGDFGPFTTIVGPGGAEIEARRLMREFLEGRRDLERGS